ncbi:TetR/AcrR family transcriptional regulator [Paracoccus sp. (in: a-proteobacteria)]|uniref:TetR/AcrR family transcriptional regulator n=1 Tax=Paracoccus sp. TaxID=267 RepID=UPI003A8B220C
MTRPPHHHGNLREALILAGLNMIGEGETLTLRGAATRAGVSHAAPAHHFDGLNGLRTAIAGRAMQMFVDALDRAGRDPDQTPLQQLVDIALAYCQFAADHVELFHLMFASREVDRMDDTVLRATLGAHAQLTRACAPFVAAGENATEIEHAAWSMTHGNAVLELQNPLRNLHAPIPGPSLESQLRRLLNVSD